MPVVKKFMYYLYLKQVAFTGRELEQWVLTLIVCDCALVRVTALQKLSDLLPNFTQRKLPVLRPFNYLPRDRLFGFHGPIRCSDQGESGQSRRKVRYVSIFVCLFPADSDSNDIKSSLDVVSDQSLQRCVTEVQISGSHVPMCQISFLHCSFILSQQLADHTGIDKRPV